MGELYRVTKEDKKERRQENLKTANYDGWEKFTEYHWYQDINGKRLDYYPSTGKFKYDEKWRCGVESRNMATIKTCNTHQIKESK